MSENISLEGLNKAAVFAALFNGSKPQGLGFLHYDPTEMTTEQAQERFGDDFGYYDYVDGRVMKVDLSGDELRPSGYDRDNGSGAAAQIINILHATDMVVSEEITQSQRDNTQKDAQHMLDNIDDKGTVELKNNMLTFNLGLDDNMANQISPIINSILDEE